MPRLNKSLSDFSSEELRGIFEYSDGQLLWKLPRVSWIKVGDVAGYTRKDGYVVVYFFGKPRLVHRIVWRMFHEDIPDLLDHIDQNPSNNRIENLRPSNKGENAYNSGRPKNNTSGVRGVSRTKSGWVSSTKEGDKYVRTSFRCLGEAIKHRHNFEQRRAGQWLETTM